MLRMVSAGPTMMVPGIVGLSTEAPTAPSGMPSSSMVSAITPVQSPSPLKRSTTPAGGRGASIILIFSGAMRPVSFFSATVRLPRRFLGFLVQLDLRVLDDLRQARGFGREEGTELLRRIADHIGALFGHLGAQVIVLEHLDDVFVQQVDDRLRRLRRRQHPEPATGDVIEAA